MNNDSPNTNPKSQADASADAANLIRQKVAQIYAGEPNAGAEAAEVKQVEARSKHQQFMYQLSTSGKDLATVQTEWHNYYVQLPDAEKHQVWQEFYESSSTIAAPTPSQPTSETSSALAVADHKHGVLYGHGQGR